MSLDKELTSHIETKQEESYFIPQELDHDCDIFCPRRNDNDCISRGLNANINKNFAEIKPIQNLVYNKTARNVFVSELRVK
ncbi:hypothetical protein CEXT_211451 [Caerostris extrusa]|uniref:Uncharacterized protein n=1 Tax=Caerostris extrusa TaxID=172846 RepID=A0AAV4QA07_CAEEX|nr:hypothetical protein CEXT_211451 [Caerostris extrusa]